MNNKALTTRQAEAVRRILAKTFPAWSDSEQPTLIMNWEGFDGFHSGPTILWEDGPYDWAIMFSEMAMGSSVIEEEFGSTYGPVTLPAGIEVEPYTGWALCLYPA